MKTFPSIALLVFFSHHQTAAQVIDDFGDGNFTASPLWLGSTSDFIVNSSGQLQLNAIVAGKSWLSTEFLVQPNQSTVWQFYVKQSFAPSGANFSRFYLMSDEADLSRPLNGYFLQFGEAGSADAIELFRQTGTTLTSVCRASAGTIASSFATMVRITRTNNGDWQLLTAFDGTDNFVVETSGTDGLHQAGKYIGLLCTYTITNATRFYFDDFHCLTTDVGDTGPPEIVSLEVVSSRVLRITFSEEMASTSVLNASHFALGELSLNPTVTEQRSDKRDVVLTFADDFNNGYQHRLAIHGVKDLAGNMIADTVITFLFFQASRVQFKDVVFSEILADPSPAVALPEAEYVELFNRSKDPVNLSGWTVSDESTAAQLAHFILHPGAYVVITNASAKFDGFGDAMYLPLPSLNNSADLLKLRDPNGVIIDSIAYSASWYTDDTNDGGWALELIDPDNLCAGSRNWTVTESTLGGTPGKENSVKASMPDNIGPVVLSVAPSDSVTIKIAFNEAIDKTIPPADQFIIEPSRDIIGVRFDDPSLASISLSIASPLYAGETYTITIGELFDCSGNILQEQSKSSQFVIPQKAEAGDVIINEILFNPTPHGVDFVEVFNRSEKVIDLRNWSLGNPHREVDKTATLSETLSIIYPGEYRVFTDDVDVLKGEYIAGHESTFRQTDLPSFNDDEGQVVLWTDRGQTIDSIYYSKDYHSPFVSDGEGISLERISGSAPGTEPSNWRSASGSSGFGTPGYANSNARTVIFPEGTVTVEPEVIRPGVASLAFTLIQYHLDQGHVMGNVKVVDAQGRSIRQIASNELLGAEGFFRWDGDVDDGSAATVGYYVIVFELFDAEGVVQIIRKRVAIF